MTKDLEQEPKLAAHRDQILKDFAQDRVQQRLVEPSVEPQMVEQLEEVPKKVTNPALLEQVSTRIWWLSEKIKMAKTASQGPELAAYSGADCRRLRTRLLHKLLKNWRYAKLSCRNELWRKFENK